MLLLKDLLLLLLLVLLQLLLPSFTAAAGISSFFLQQGQLQQFRCTDTSGPVQRSSTIPIAFLLRPLHWGPQWAPPACPQGPWLSALFAVPKKRTSHSKTRSRRATWVRRKPKNHYKFSSVDLIGPHLSGGFSLTLSRTAASSWLGLPGFLVPLNVLRRGPKGSAAADFYSPPSLTEAPHGAPSLTTENNTRQQHIRWKLEGDGGAP